GELSFLPYGKEGQFINSISRRDLNVLLIEEAEKGGAIFRFNQRCVNVDLETTTLTLTPSTSQPVNTSTHQPVNTSTHQHINTSTHQHDIIIGADGAFSAVRGAMQFTDRFNFSQEYIDHGYKELHIPAGSDGVYQLEKNALHIWPRESFMMIALPNPDGSFTCTLFFPFEGPLSFKSLGNDDAILEFFRQHFPDALKLMPGVLQDFHANPSSSLVTMRCFPWVRNNTLLIGDAAHAIVPFYGQGMNAGFEDCRVLNQLLDHYRDDWHKVLPAFQEERKPDTDAIATLALDNFIEMRDLVADADFLLRKKIEAKLHALYPDEWIPLYSMVTFHDNIHYADAYHTGQKQRKIMDEVMRDPDIAATWQTLPFQKIVRQLLP
ncbi:MAG TPA: NAD(P)/FAD-dependent oxidoreductase, partial [Ohtaekwangia sp.]|nr:NAD(P)/FAD-dependent oxidoreductase [Ohtaekwangia sp.]